MKHMLCVVDMQYPFVQHEADSAYIREVRRLIVAAKQRAEHICLLEDQAGMPTLEAICCELEGYAKQSRLLKQQWDGSLQIAIELSDKLGCLPERISACGAFAEECVRATLVGLRERFPQIELEVWRKACVPAPVGRFTESDWQKFAARHRLILS